MFEGGVGGFDVLDGVADELGIDIVKNIEAWAGATRAGGEVVGVWFERGLKGDVAKRGTAYAEDDHVFAAIAWCVLGEVGVCSFLYLLDGGEVFGAERIEGEITPTGLVIGAHLGEAVGEVGHFGCGGFEGIGGEAVGFAYAVVEEVCVLELDGLVLVFHVVRVGGNDLLGSILN